MTESRSTEADPLETTRHLAYAEASVMLVESLLRLLVEERLLPREKVLEAVEDAIATKRIMVDERLHPHISAVASGVLIQLANSLAATPDTHADKP